MKHVKLLVVAMAGVVMSATSGHAQLSLNFSSSPGGAPTGGATIQFNGSGSSFQFNAATTPYSIPNPPFPPIVVAYYVGSQWSISSVAGGTGSALNLLGAVNNGPFNYGPITISGVDQSASVTGPLGGLVINDNAGFNLTGTVDWVQVATHDYGGSIGINAALTVNITGLNYLGANPDLQTLAGSGLGGMDLTFQFSPGMTLSQLTSGSGSYQTSFSGSIAPVPEPTTVGCFLLGLGGLILSRRFRSSFQKNKRV